MADDGDLISRADLLLKADAGSGSGEQSDHPRPLRRRRSFIASTTPAATRETARGGATAPIADDDLPLLTEVVSPDQIISESLLDVAGLRRTITSELVQLLGSRLQQAMPVLLEAALRRAIDEWHEALAETIDTTLREFSELDADMPQPGETGAPGAAADQG